MITEARTRWNSIKLWYRRNRHCNASAKIAANAERIGPNGSRYHRPSGHVGRSWERFALLHELAQMHDKKPGINMHNLSEQWRERGSLSKAGSWTSRARRGNKRRNDPLVPIRPWKRPLLRFVRPQMNKILREHHYCANCEHRAKSKECALGSLHRKFHSYVCRANARNTMSRFHTRDNHRILLRRDVCTPLRNRRSLEMSNRRITRWTFTSWPFRFFFFFSSVNESAHAFLHSIGSQNCSWQKRAYQSLHNITSFF